MNQSSDSAAGVNSIWKLESEPFCGCDSRSFASTVGEGTLLAPFRFDMRRNTLALAGVFEVIVYPEHQLPGAWLSMACSVRADSASGRCIGRFSSEHDEGNAEPAANSAQRSRHLVNVSEPSCAVDANSLTQDRQGARASLVSSRT